MPQWALNAFSPVRVTHSLQQRISSVVGSVLSVKGGQKAILSANSLKLLYFQGQRCRKVKPDAGAHGAGEESALDELPLHPTGPRPNYGLYC